MDFLYAYKKFLRKTGRLSVKSDVRRAVFVTFVLFLMGTVPNNHPQKTNDDEQKDFFRLCSKLERIPYVDLKELPRYKERASNWNYSSIKTPFYKKVQFS